MLRTMGTHLSSWKMKLMLIIIMVISLIIWVNRFLQLVFLTMKVQQNSGMVIEMIFETRKRTFEVIDQFEQAYLSVISL